MEDLLVVAKNFWILLNGKIFQNREENLNLLYKHISPFTHSSSYIIFWGECTRSFVKHTSLGISGSRLTWNANNFTGGGGGVGRVGVVSWKSHSLACTSIHYHQQAQVLSQLIIDGFVRMYEEEREALPRFSCFNNLIFQEQRQCKSYLLRCIKEWWSVLCLISIVKKAEIKSWSKNPWEKPWNWITKIL